MHDIENIEGGVEVSVGAIFLLLKWTFFPAFFINLKKLRFTFIAFSINIKHRCLQMQLLIFYKHKVKKELIKYKTNKCLYLRKETENEKQKWSCFFFSYEIKTVLLQWKQSRMSILWFNRVGYFCKKKNSTLFIINRRFLQLEFFQLVSCSCSSRPFNRIREFSFWIQYVCSWNKHIRILLNWDSRMEECLIIIQKRTFVVLKKMSLWK
jgi:hypothetical protein